jgi:formate dehydrogenase subunit delta
MKIDALLKMANQIADFFETQPGPEASRVAFVKHLKNMWEPRMRRELEAHLEATGGAGLSEFARQALREPGALR